MLGLPLLAFSTITSVISVWPILFPKKEDQIEKKLEIVEICKVDQTKVFKDTVFSKPQFPRRFYVAYELTNIGNVAIMPSDFAGPSGLFTPPDNQITVVYSMGSAGLDDLVLDCEWSTSNHRDWSLKPLLINPKQKVRFGVLLTAAQNWNHHPDFDPDSVIHWRWSVVGVSEVPVTTIGLGGNPYDWIIKQTMAKYGLPKKPITTHFVFPDHSVGEWDTAVQANVLGEYFFSFSRRRAWSFIFLGIGLFGINSYFFARTRILSSSPLLSTVCCLVLLFYSFAMAEIIVYVSKYPIKTLASASYLILITYILTIGTMLWALKKKAS